MSGAPVERVLDEVDRLADVLVDEAAALVLTTARALALLALEVCA